jgi:hypothetical protein
MRGRHIPITKLDYSCHIRTTGLSLKFDQVILGRITLFIAQISQIAFTELLIHKVKATRKTLSFTYDFLLPKQVIWVEGLIERLGYTAKANVCFGALVSNLRVL